MTSVSSEDELREWLVSLPQLEAVRSLLDLGCGVGQDLKAFAERVAAPDARFRGLDVSRKALAEARERCGDDERIALVHCELGRDPLPVEAESVDLAYSKDLLECIGERTEFLRQVSRVLRPGGQVVMAHWDWDSQVLNGVDKAMIRRVVHAFADWKQDWMDHADGWMGRRLWSLFQSTGLFAGEIRACVLVETSYTDGSYGYARVQDFSSLRKRDLITAEDHTRVLADIQAQAASGAFFYSITSYAFVGRKL